MKKAVIIALLLAVLISVCGAQAEAGFYVQQGNSISYSPQQPPKGKIKEWRIYLYKAADAPGDWGGLKGSPSPYLKPGYWGTIDGKSAESVMKQLKQSQDFARKWARWCKCGADETEYDHYLGPVAVMETPYEKQQNAGLADLFRSIQNELNSVTNVFNGITEVLGQQAGDSLPPSGEARDAGVRLKQLHTQLHQLPDYRNDDHGTKKEKLKQQQKQIASIGAEANMLKNKLNTDTLKIGNQKFDNREYGDAFKLLMPHAIKGDSQAMFNVGYMYEYGLGVGKNHCEALQWYRRAADQGDPYAEINIGLAYDNGRCVSENSNEAKRWFRRALDNSTADDNARTYARKFLGY
jgi:hypothetical protein